MPLRADDRRGNSCPTNRRNAAGASAGLASVAAGRCAKGTGGSPTSRCGTNVAAGATVARPIGEAIQIGGRGAIGGVTRREAGAGSTRAFDHSLGKLSFMSPTT